MLTVPVFSKGRRDQDIRDVQIDRSGGFPESHLKALEHNYRKAPRYADYINEFTAIMRKGHDCLAELTIELIVWLKDSIGVDAELVRSSSLGVSGAKVELLVAICKSVGAERYLSPAGSRVYIEENNLFPRSNLALEYQNYEHPLYRQLYGDFIPYLSVIDLLFNEGERSLEIIRSGRR